MKEIDWVMSKRIADIVDARVGECVTNVLRAFLDHPDILPKDAVFVEGLYVLGGQEGLHAWIETTDSIIDPTIVNETKGILSERIQHHKVHSRDKNEILELYGDEPREPGNGLQMKLTWDDPRIDEIIREINKDLYKRG